MKQKFCDLIHTVFLAAAILQDLMKIFKFINISYPKSQAINKILAGRISREKSASYMKRRISREKYQTKR